jgi:carboxyl-terminal processing protease
MSQKWLSLAFGLITAALGALVPAGAAAPALSPSTEQVQAARLSAEVVRRFHYKAAPLDDAFSSRIFDQYVKGLDPERLLFTQADINQLAPARTQLDNSILEGNLGAPFAIFNLYARRLNERFGYARSLLKQKMDFQQNEVVQPLRDKAPWPPNESALRDLWRKQVKNDWLRLKLAGRDEKGIIETLDRRYENSLRRINQISSEDAFAIFMNAYTTALDPHTSYLSPKAAANFNISMRLALIGIGAVLQEKDEYTIIRELIPGGPAAASKQLDPGDRIVGVAQGEAGAFVDIMGWRTDDVVGLIRGQPNSVVRLDILPAAAGADGKHKVVTLIRKAITLEEQAAKKTILTVPGGKTAGRIGVITLPSFYEDFGGRHKGAQDYRSATRDVARLLRELKQENVGSVLIDLRNNGGGSLNEAISLTGLFIDRGPVVQQRDAKGGVRLERDSEAGVAWDGPMGVLINRNSASASEIFAAAIQDYGRGLVIGEPSFGKGTVQSVIDLDELIDSDKPRFGGLRLTISQFFRINGGTTQLRGVKPDILFPSVLDEEDFGESSFDNPLPWMQITPASYSPAGNAKSLLPKLSALHQARVKRDKDFQFLLEDIAMIRAQRKKNLVSLNEAERLKERNAEEARMAAREAVRGKGGTGARPVFRDDGLQSNERTLANELAEEKARKGARDVFLEEASRILSDELNLLGVNRSVVTRNSPPARLAPN